METEFARLKQRSSGFLVVVAFAAAVLVFGALSFFAPHRFWQTNALQVTLSPSAIFVILLAAILAALIDVRREMSLQRYRLAAFASRQQPASKIEALTNVLSRMTLREMVAGEILRAERTQRPLAFIMAGVNNLKPVRERYGAMMRDYVLAQVASILKESVRGCDYIIRCGDSEFLVLLPETNEAGAESVRQRIQQRVVEWDRSSRVGDFSISVALGLYFHVAGQSPEKDVAESFIRMYAEKQAFRREGVASTRPTGSGPN